MNQPSPRPGWLDAVPKKDGRYALGPLLGHGGMGDVFEAWDTLLGRVVALKILTHVEPAAMVRFMHEARLQARLEHPNICRIYDVDLAGGVPRISMQVVKGPTLEDASQDLELPEIVAIIATVAETLRDAHQSGLIHRDVKPGNIILEWTDTGWNPIICDFGLALALNESSLTQPNALTGTPAYMAPEQIRGDRRHIGPATDVYGLGGTLYFLLVGRPPCVTTATQEMLRVKKERRFPQPRSLEPSIPEELEAILLRCLAPAPEDRYPGMEPLARDLWAFLGKAPRKAHGFRRRPWLGAACAALALAAGLGGLAWRHATNRAQWSELANQAAQEAENLEQGLREEREQPVHDTRRALTRIRAAKESTTRLFGAPDGTGEGPRALVLGTADLCLGDYPSARTELENAWTKGLTAPASAYLLGLACAEEWMVQAQEAAYQGTAASPLLRREAALWFSRAKGLSRDREEYALALMACMFEDLEGAVRHARACQAANPWHREAVALGALCLSRQARAFQTKGNTLKASQAYLEALGWAEEGVHQAQSDSRLHHAAITAGLGLAQLARSRGELAVATLDQLSVRAEQALELDPDGPVAQSDWLAVQCLKAMRQADLGQNPQQTLQGALAFYWTRTQEPRPPGLRAAHMVLYWLVALQDTARGQAPDNALAEALKGAGHTVADQRDYLEDLLQFKATQQEHANGGNRSTLRATGSPSAPAPTSTPSA